MISSASVFLLHRVILPRRCSGVFRGGVFSHATSSVRITTAIRSAVVASSASYYCASITNTSVYNNNNNNNNQRIIEQQQHNLHSGRSSSSSSRHHRRFYSSVTNDDLNVFRSIVLDTEEGDDGGGRIITATNDDDDDDDNDLIEPFYIDWTRQYTIDEKKGRRRKVVLQPSTAQQVSRILSHCYERNIAIVPQGGNTGLVGGSVPCITTTTTTTNDDENDNNGQEIVLSTSRMNRKEESSLTNCSGILQCQAGCILQNLQDYAAERGYVVPIDLGAAGTCQIGGNISTNAGGIFYYRYGSIASNLLGLTVVLPDSNGTILHLGSNNLKDNTGYKLHQLFVGSEGTLGVVTDVALHCPKAPQSKQTALLLVSSSGGVSNNNDNDDRRSSYHENVIKVMDAAKRDLGEILGCLEWMDGSIVRILGKNHDIPIISVDESNGEFALLLLETHGSNQDHDTEKLYSFLESSMEDGSVQDGVVAQDTKQQNEFWLLRESCNPEMKVTGGYSYKYDLSLPSTQFVDFITEMDTYMKEKEEDFTSSSSSSICQGHWGHILDGNLHYNLTTAEYDPKLVQYIEPRIYESIAKRGGSVSAEHGLGQAKRNLLKMVHDQSTLDTMRSVKKLFDPKAILNPGKFLP